MVHFGVFEHHLLFLDALIRQLVCNAAGVRYALRTLFVINIMIAHEKKWNNDFYRWCICLISRTQLLKGSRKLCNWRMDLKVYKSCFLLEHDSRFLPQGSRTQSYRVLSLKSDCRTLSSYKSNHKSFSSIFKAVVFDAAIPLAKTT